jgi:hypothetical protein
MRQHRFLLLFGLLAYAWMAGGLATAAVVLANHDHHHASLQFAGDSVTVLLQHDDHHDDGDGDAAHLDSEHRHADHVLTLPQADTDASVTDAGNTPSPKGAPAATCDSAPTHARLTPLTGRIAAQPPPPARSNAMALRACAVLLI